MRLDPELARAAFAALETPLPLEQRIGFAFRIAAANIAEEVTNVVLRRGGDPRDFTLVAYGAAGPMLLPAALDLMHVRRVVVPPHPGNFSALGLLGSDLVYYDVRSAYVPLLPGAAAQIEAVFAEMERGLRKRAGRDGTIRRSFDGRLFGQSWETPFVEVPDGPIDVAGLVERFHDDLRAPLRQPLRRDPCAGRQLPRRAARPLGEGRAGAAPRRAATRRPGRLVEMRHFADGPLEALEYDRAALPAGARIAGPAVIREALATTFVVPGQTAEVGRLGELEDRGAA